MSTLSTFALAPVWPLKESERRVLALIEPRLGRRNRISIAKIREETGYKDRFIKGAVKELVEIYRWRIGSCREKADGGYFLIADAEDIRLATRSFRGEIRSLMRRVQVIERVSARDLANQVSEQLSLFEVGDTKSPVAPLVLPQTEVSASAFTLPPARPDKDSLRRVLALIEPRLGRRNRISIAKIREETGYKDRFIKGAVKELVEIYRWRIGSCREKADGGYFLIADAEDIRLATRSFRGEIRSLMRRVQVIERVSARDLANQVSEQLSLFDSSTDTTQASLAIAQHPEAA